jgi:probable phosphoglycerate mutase
VAARDDAALTAWTASPSVPAPGGESIDEVAARVLRARDRIAAAHPEQQVLVVSHVTPIKVLVRDALGAPPSSLHHMYLDTGSLSAVDHFADGARSLRLFNDTAHASSRWARR